MKLPDHKCGLYLTHNEHRNLYEPLVKWLVGDGDEDGFYNWESDEARQRALDTDECWTLQWYPDTPIGFHAVAAPTLEELLAFANKP